LYNKSHSKTIDLIHSTTQKYFSQKDFNLQDNDFAQMRKDASLKVGTQKVLLVGHSQGNFYVNTLYDALADEPGGVPSMSLSVYGVASPSNRISGGGSYITSTTDKIISSYVTSAPFTNTLKPNANIKFKQSDGDPNGHSFSKIYLPYEGERIVREIKTSLDRLQNNNIQDEFSPCIAPLKSTLAQKAQGVLLAVADPVLSGTESVVINSYKGLSALGNGIINTSKSFASGFMNFAKSVAGLSDGSSASVSASDFSLEDGESPAIEEEPVVATPEVVEDIPQDTILPPPVVEEPQEEVLPPDETEVQEEIITTPVPTIFSGGVGGGGGGSSVPEPEPEEIIEDEPEEEIVEDPEPDVTPPEPPVVDALPEWSNTDSILVTGTAEAGVTINIAGGLSGATGVATDGEFSVEVFLNQNVANTLIVTAIDAALNASTEVEVSTTHDNIAPVISRMFLPASFEYRLALVGGILQLNIETDGSDYEMEAISINDILVTDFFYIGGNTYGARRLVSLGEADRGSGDIPLSVVLKDKAGNTNIPYTEDEDHGLSINGQFPSSSNQVFPTFTPDGKFTQNVVLDCISYSGNPYKYAVQDSDSKFYFNSGNTAGINCVGDKYTFVTSGTGFADILGYQPIVGWYYGAISIGFPNCWLEKSGQVCTQSPVQSFFRLHRDADGVWSDVYPPPEPEAEPEPDVTPPVITSYIYNGVSESITTDPLLSPLTLVFNTDEDVDWVSIKIENEVDDSIYKIFFSGSAESDCADNTSTCTKTWDGLLSSGGLLSDGTYRVKVKIQDASENEFFDYLAFKIMVDITD
ncbi:MAG: Ig-like domain-containing protein, partial [Candidatus Paceibacterota bacterium]